MKLAEALLLRADVKKKLASLQSRAPKYAFVQEGDRPAEEPTELLAEADEAAETLRRLVFRINKTNLAAALPDGRSLTEGLAARDSLVERHRTLSLMIDACTRAPERHGVKEIRWVATVSVATLQKQSDEVARTIRETNVAIQEAGWRVELVD